jgi:hypothetical protein
VCAVRHSIATRSSRVKEIELVEVIRGTPFNMVHDVVVGGELEGDEEVTELPPDSQGLYRVEWIFQVTEEVLCLEGTDRGMCEENGGREE